MKSNLPFDEIHVVTFLRDKGLLNSVDDKAVVFTEGKFYSLNDLLDEYFIFTMDKYLKE